MYRRTTVQVQTYALKHPLTVCTGGPLYQVYRFKLYAQTYETSINCVYRRTTVQVQTYAPKHPLTVCTGGPLYRFKRMHESISYCCVQADHCTGSIMRYKTSINCVYKQTAVPHSLTGTSLPPPPFLFLHEMKYRAV